jgi:signal transduction histidine kinase
MSRSLPLRRKIAVAFALPVLALGSVAAAALVDAAQDGESARSARAAFDQVSVLQNAALAVADERLSTVLIDTQGSQSSAATIEQAALATDAAMERLSALGDEVLIDRVRTALGAARSTPVGRSDNYGRASGILLETASLMTVDSQSSIASVVLADLDRVHRLIEADDAAWLAFTARTSDDLRSTTEVAQLFAVAAALREDLDLRTQNAPDSPIQQALRSTKVMSDLRLTAMEDLLNNEQMLLAPGSAILSHNDAHLRWAAARDQQASIAGAQLDAVIQSAEDQRNTFGLFGLFGVLVLSATAVALYQSVSSPLAAAASEARKLVREGLPRIDRAFSAGDIDQTRLKHLSVSADDEVDQLVGAINSVQDRFFDIAAREARIRQQMSGRMVTIGHRNAGLLHELVRHVSSWRNCDDSPEVRQRLFAIDHIATRLQRNIETGLTFVGGRSDRRWIKPISALNTARLALGEVTDFDRVDISPMEDVRLHGLAAPDIAHVLAEVIENGLAAGAGRPQSANRVNVQGEWVAAGWAFLVHDSGPGTEQADRDRINRALHTPDLAGDEPTSGLGVAVIGRIAMRLGLDVRLLERPTGGTTARVVLPVELIDPDTIPSDRKRIDAGRGARLGEEPAFGPPGADQQSAADAYFGAETTSPLEQEHDVDAQLRNLTAADV